MSIRTLILACALLGPCNPASFAQATDKTAGPAASTPSDALAEAEQLYRARKFDEAAAKYEAVLKQNPKAGDAYAGLARAYLGQDKVHQAYETASTGVKDSADPTAAHVALGEVYFRQFRIQDAEREFVPVANSPQRQARAFLGLARLYWAASLHKKSKQMIDRAYELDARDPEIRRFWLSTLSRSRQIKELQAYLASETQDEPDQRESLEHRLTLLQERQEHPEKACKLVTKVASTTANLRQLYNGPKDLRGYGLDIKLNGQNATLLLDTGASGILIGKKVAERVGLKRSFSSTIRGIGDQGPVPSYGSYVDSIKIGELEFQNCLVEVSEKASVVEDEGLIGADVFRRYLVTINLPKEKLELAPLPRHPEEELAPLTLDTAQDAAPGKDDSPVFLDRYVGPGMQSYTKIFNFGSHLFIPTQLNDGPWKLFLIDTGAFNNIVSVPAANEVSKTSTEPDWRIRGVSGEVKKVSRADMAVLTFNHWRQVHKDITALDLSHISHGTGTEVSGVIGFGLLKMFALRIDYRDGLVDFEYDPSKDPNKYGTTHW